MKPATCSTRPTLPHLGCGLLLCLAALLPATGRAQAALPQAVQAVQARATAQLQPVLETLKSLVAVESGSRDLDGLGQLAGLVAARLKAAGMATQIQATQAPDFHRFRCSAKCAARESPDGTEVSK